MAARGARAAADEAADHRVLGYNHAFSHGPMGRRFRAATARTRLDRRPQYRDRVSMGGGAQRALRRDRSRVSAAQGRCHRHDCEPAVPCGQAGDIGDPNRVCIGGSGPSWQRPRREPGATGRQRHRAFDPVSPILRGKRLELLREIVPRSSPVGDHGQCRLSRRRAGDGSEVQAAARTLGLEVVSLEIRRARGYRAGLRGAQGPRGCALCRGRRAR